MEKIELFLEKYKNFGQSEKKLKEKIIKTIKDFFDINLETRQIEIKNGKIFIKISGVEKAEIFLNKNKLEKILEKEII
jgi:uncharacterized ubiquitin-like protein YukD